MNNEEDLTGTLVLVHPELQEDPVNKQGQIGMLLYANTDKDDMYVTFGKGEQALYSSSALLIPKRSKDIFADLMENSKKIPVADFKTLFQVSNLLDLGTSLKAKEAMQLIAANPSVIPRATITLEERLGLETSQEAAVTETLAVGRGR